MVERKQAPAFNTEFYERSSTAQIEDDLISYLGEYRFKVPDFTYKLGFVNGNLVDPNSGELMTQKGKSAVKTKIDEGLNFSREKAELKGLYRLEDQLAKNPKGTVVWFSPPGKKEEGYGDYGFAYVGKLRGEELEMTAIRLESPSLVDFNKTSEVLWQGKYEQADGFLENPRVLEVNKEQAEKQIRNNFKVGNKERNDIFDKGIVQLSPAITECAKIIKTGDKQTIHIALHALENLSIEINGNMEQDYKQGAIYIARAKVQAPDLKTAMLMPKYTAAPPVAYGSCGISGKKESNDIFRNLSKPTINTSGSRDFKFDQDGPCRLCGRDVSCGPCKICEKCNDEIDINESAILAA